jgi:hypothetical protein
MQIKLKGAVSAVQSKVGRVGTKGVRDNEARSDVRKEAMRVRLNGEMRREK